MSADLFIETDEQVIKRPPRTPAPRRPSRRDQVTAIVTYIALAAFVVSFWWIVGSLVAKVVAR